MPVATVAYRDRHKVESLRRPSQEVIPQEVYSQLSHHRSPPQLPKRKRRLVIGPQQDQPQSRLLSLPQELRDIIWKLYFADHKEAIREQTTIHDDKFVLREHHKSLRLTCRQVEKETKEIRRKAPWTLTIHCDKHNLVPLQDILGHYKLNKILNKIHKVLVIGLDSGCNYWRRDFLHAWPAVRRLPNLKCVSLVSTDTCSHYFTHEPDGTYSAHLFDTKNFGGELMQGEHDDMYSKCVERYGLEKLANLLKKAKRERTQIYILSRKTFRGEREFYYQDSITFRVFHDGIQTWERNGQPVDRNVGMLQNRSPDQCCLDLTV